MPSCPTAPQLKADELSALDGLTHGVPSLAVVDTASFEVVYRYRAPGEGFFAGIVALRDPLNPANVLVLASGGPHSSSTRSISMERVFDLGDAGTRSQSPRATRFRAIFGRAFRPRSRSHPTVRARTSSITSAATSSRWDPAYAHDQRRGHPDRILSFAAAARARS